MCVLGRNTTKASVARDCRHMADQYVYFIWFVPSTHCSKSLVSDEAAHQKVSVIYIKLFTGTKADIKRDSSERVKQSTLHVGVKTCPSLHLHKGTISTLVSFNTSESYFQNGSLQLVRFSFLGFF